MRKGFVNILEIILVAVILLMAFAHFFPQYKVDTDWDNKLLELELRDTLVTIENLDITFDLATDNDTFEVFMGRVFQQSSTGDVYVWWKKVDGLPDGLSYDTPYYTRGSEKTIVAVTSDPVTFVTTGYTFSLGLGTPY